MNTFSFYNPVRIHFGKGVIENLKSELKHYGDNILVVYGGGSIKQNGVYDDVMQQLNELNKNVYELSGVEPNPRVSTARKGIEICKEHSIDFVLAVGGGSVIDCAKLIVVGATVEADAWDIVMKKAIPTSACHPEGARRASRSFAEKARCIQRHKSSLHFDMHRPRCTVRSKIAAGGIS